MAHRAIYNNLFSCAYYITQGVVIMPGLTSGRVLLRLN